MDFCKHLEISDLPEGKTYRRAIYGQGGYPELCAQFNCVSWAKANDTYTARNSLLVKAQEALNRLRDTGVRPYSQTGFFAED